MRDARSVRLDTVASNNNLYAGGIDKNSISELVKYIKDDFKKLGIEIGEDELRVLAKIYCTNLINRGFPLEVAMEAVRCFVEEYQGTNDRHN